MLASPILHLPNPASIAPKSTITSQASDSSPPSQIHHLDLASLSTPVPSVTLNQPPSPHSFLSQPDLSDKRLRRRSRLPSFFARLSSASPTRSFRGQVNASLHAPIPLEPPATASAVAAAPSVSAASADAGDIATHELPRDLLGDHDSQSESQPNSATFSRTSGSPSLVALSTSRSKSPSLASSTRNQSDTLTISSQDRCPEIFTSTTSCRLSVPLIALHHLQSITENDISRKMHQTSSRLLRMTDDERPYTRVCTIKLTFILSKVSAIFFGCICSIECCAL
jgi:hypothetical protein